MFKIGDKVVRVLGNYAGMKKGDIGTIKDVDDDSVRIEEYETTTEKWHDVEKLELTEHVKEENEI